MPPLYRRSLQSSPFIRAIPKLISRIRHAHSFDGDLIGKGTADRFRIKIWHRDDSTNADMTDYDNQINSTAAGSDQEGTVIGGGSISVKIR